MNYSCGAQGSFGTAEDSKKNTHPLIFCRMGCSGNKKKLTNLSCAYQGLESTHQKYQCSAKYFSIQKKIPTVFGSRKSPENEYK